MKGLDSIYSELIRIDEIFAYLSTQYTLKKYKPWARRGLRDSQKLLPFLGSEIFEEPWLSVRYNWEWFDRKDSNGISFGEHLLLSDPKLPHRSVLEKMLSTRIGVYQVTGIPNKQEMILRDFLTGLYYTVPVINPSELCLPWSLLITRLYSIGNRWLLVEYPFQLSPAYSIHFRDVRKEWTEKSSGLQLYYEAAMVHNSPEVEEHLQKLNLFFDYYHESPEKYRELLDKVEDRSFKLDIYQTLHHAMWKESIETKRWPNSFEQEFRSLGLAPFFRWDLEIASNLENQDSYSEDGLEFLWDDGELSDREMIDRISLFLDELSHMGILSDKVKELLLKWEEGEELNEFEWRLLQNEMKRAEKIAGEQADLEERQLVSRLKAAEEIQTQTDFNWFGDTVDLFMQEEMKEKSESTKRKYMDMFVRFRAYLESYAPADSSWETLNREQIEEFVCWWYIRKDMSSSKTGAENLVGALTKFLKWLHKQGCRELWIQCEPLLKEWKVTLPQCFRIMDYFHRPNIQHLVRINGASDGLEGYFQIMERKGDKRWRITDLFGDRSYTIHVSNELDQYLSPGFTFSGLIVKKGNRYLMGDLYFVHPPSDK
ncbi:hypothetical protein [Effusibacillus lacus]|uniref:Core-binding (CB) domain-containing protein n=1 Tax=Effusibacillus lacus TaxID=1348429 RepID=A0A292YQZ3_9BACL|nr:hypothetical protein [Effusibacillus lacus]TCS76841.1 hypothetical protein EDD64_10162 [Effusibacillus lacus]GAX91173.1 hypothetical protein EFBL_2839 [Effusibacillus lacus]